jgi:dihydroorotase
MSISRRRFLTSTAVASAALVAQAAGAEGTPSEGTSATALKTAGFNPNDPALKYDLVIAGGDVLDPSQKLRDKRDIGIKNGQIAALAEHIPLERSVQRIDAAGKLVTPGLVDLHTHYCPHISGIGLPADELVGITATTTAVSCGDASWHTFGGFRHWVAANSRTRLFAFVHISSIGLTGNLGPGPGEMMNLDYANIDGCAKTVAENPDMVLGVKVRISDYTVGQNGIEPLRRAIKAAEVAGPGARVMCHIGRAPGSLADLLDLLRPGDVLTHAFSGAGNNVVQNGKLLPAAIAAKQRGVIMDVGHGGGSFDFTIADSAMQQGLMPDTISSDLHGASINSPSYPTLPWVMTKFLALGMPLEEIVAKTTVEPAKVIGRVPGLGTLQIGAPADVSVLEIVEGPVEMVDTMKNARRGGKRVVPVLTVREGRPFGRPPLPLSFTY